MPCPSISRCGSEFGFYAEFAECPYDDCSCGDAVGVEISEDADAFAVLRGGEDYFDGLFDARQN